MSILYHIPVYIASAVNTVYGNVCENPFSFIKRFFCIDSTVKSSSKYNGSDGLSLKVNNLSTVGFQIEKHDYYNGSEGLKIDSGSAECRVSWAYFFC